MNKTVIKLKGTEEHIIDIHIYLKMQKWQNKKKGIDRRYMGGWLHSIDVNFHIKQFSYSDDEAIKSDGSYIETETEIKFW